METGLPDVKLHCTQCGGELHPDEGQIFLTCPYCGAEVFIDKSQVVFHWYLAPTLDEGKARAELARWMAGNQTVKDLDKKAQMLGGSFEYFPLWYFKRRTPGGKEEITLEVAAATSVSELRRLTLPAGDLRAYDPKLESQVVKPTVPLQAARAWMVERQIPEQEISEQALVHIPVFTFKYAYQRNTYTALVEAGTGGVFANIFPAKAEVPYRMAGGLTALVFLCLASFPVIGALSNYGNGAGIGLAICAGAGILVAPFLFALAAWVASRI
jgi:DNA-directed RNA polymerase subunit RPC12/RpoP